MQRYFVPHTNWKENEVIIDGDDAHHIVRVMRFQVGDNIIANHPEGKASICEIVHIEDRTVQAVIKEWLDGTVELPVEVTIAQGLPKGDKFDLVLQKGTELGANQFIPYQAERSIVKWDKKKADKKLQRYSKIVKEASEQSHRNQIPVIKPVMNLTELIKESDYYDVKIFPYEEEAKTSTYNSFGNVVQGLSSGKRILVCIGPEGGFSENEVGKLRDNGFLPVRLGPRILRTETASLYVLSSISYHLEELGC
ncbi:16S rRNA (uracil(1498)-N(3))-methyltransferase [Ornithinibacillus halophilus]|uniref:Ribosomal RNA small subunit methyltransferase E n=1 Tax=Ornithinibacillus halophilus TaxID=930117 RepID=A0A1M5DMB5_9BACI|nr:16S rRNA (uracil(1498)-N(3))-methyltransferase [Ornithinibacillus halophilus]SHF67922.1 16S rRNA (uracil1498-N3)-methyltransferase [Ornithinibacillus halophilus]